MCSSTSPCPTNQSFLPPLLTKESPLLSPDLISDPDGSGSEASSSLRRAWPLQGDMISEQEQVRRRGLEGKHAYCVYGLCQCHLPLMKGLLKELGRLLEGTQPILTDLL